MCNHCITVSCSNCGASRCVRCDLRYAPDDATAINLQENVTSGKAVKAEGMDCPYCNVENSMYYD
jgi:predicted metal-binding protein